MAQRQRRDWRDSFSIMAHFWQIALRTHAEGGQVEPVLGRF